jgi:hypothetical protein
MNLDKNQIIAIFSISFALLLLATFLIGYFIFKRYGSPFPKLMKGFDKKMWMTIGLGLFFFGSYITMVFLVSWMTNFPNIFLYFYNYPSEAIYIGLATFAFVTLTIYLIRLVIKKLYHSRHSK